MAFIQQKASTSRVNPTQDDEQVLEALVGFDTVSQSTLLLKKKKEMHQVDDRLDDVKFLHSPFVERSPAGGWPMKYALLGEYNPTMSSVIGTKTSEILKPPMPRLQDVV